jgi:hypothetical protein
VLAAALSRVVRRLKQPTYTVASPSLLLLRFTSCLSLPLRPLTSDRKLSKLLFASRSSATGHTSNVERLHIAQHARSPL